MTQPASFLEVGRNHLRRIQTLGIKKITKISWFLGSRMGLVRVGGKTRWMEVLAGVEVGEGFRGWVHQEGGSLRWIRMDLEETLAVRVDQAVTRTSSLGLEVWVRAAEAEEEGTLVVEAEADVMEGTVEVGVGMEVPGGMTIVIVTAIILREVTTAEGEEAIIEVVGAETVHAGEVVEVVAAVAVVGDTKLSLAHASLNSTLVRSRTSRIQYHGSAWRNCSWYEALSLDSGKN